MFQRVYLGEEARAEQERARRALRALFEHYLEHLDEVPATDPTAEPVQRVTDYLAGMTDRFCLSTYERLMAGNRHMRGCPDDARARDSATRETQEEQPD